ncbi:unnamed protein product [Polarella glacialis]|uniref:Uncharacterized protein n=1 Tax=Polarella glacialis TaxID=89957 RepID=A0A813D961_POLGL|nr:unnamed protein product [Polarella glacialis]
MTAVSSSPAVHDASAPFVEKRSNAQRNRARVHKRWFFKGLRCSGGPPGLAEVPADVKQDASTPHQWAEPHQQASNWTLQPRDTAASNNGVPDSPPGLQNCTHTHTIPKSEAETTDSEWDGLEGILNFTAAVQVQRMNHYELQSADVPSESCYASKPGTVWPAQKESSIPDSIEDFMFPGLSYLTYSDAGQLSAVSTFHAAFIYQLGVDDTATFPTTTVIEEHPNVAVNSLGCLTSRQLGRLNKSIVDLASQEDVSDPVLAKLQQFWLLHPWCIP